MKYVIQDYRKAVKDETHKTRESAEKRMRELTMWNTDSRCHIVEVPENKEEILEVVNKDLRLQIYKMEGTLESFKEIENKYNKLREQIELATKDMTDPQCSVGIHYWGSKIKQILEEGKYVPPAQVHAADFSQLTGDEINKLRAIIKDYEHASSLMKEKGWINK